MKPDSSNKYDYGTTLVLKKENPRKIFKDMTGIFYLQEVRGGVEPP